ncbi:uncharacterized protein lrguk [Pholidichthys leucotaenia]
MARRIVFFCRKQHAGNKSQQFTTVSPSCCSPRVAGSLSSNVKDNEEMESHNLSDISVLCSYVHLQKLELPHNKIKDLSCVNHMPYLVTLDAAHNEISDFFEFQPPKNLKEVNFSHNRMTKMKDLAAYLSLSKLDLDYNSFTEISGLEHCCNLTHLSLAHNKISRISGLDSLPLTYLCLKGNQLTKIEGLDNLKNLQMLDLSLNRITRLSGLENLHLLGTINMEKNLICEIQECKHIHDLLLLRDLSLLGNPLQEQSDYHLAVIFLLQHLTVLDQEKVTPEEKVSSVNKYDPPLELVAARDHITHLVHELMQPQILYDSTLPSADSPYPMLVLTGPQGCGKRELVHRLCQEFNEYFAYGTSHTTRGPYFGEENGIDYHFVSEEDFQNLIHMGKFIQTMQYGGHSYGLSRDAIEDVAREGLACCVHMELEGVFSLKKSYFEPQYILLIPTQVEKYTGHLKNRGLYTAAQIDVAVSRIELYTHTNRQRPGFFDNVIPCDDWEEAYHRLRQVVKEYLLLDEQEEGKNHRASSDNTSTASGPDSEVKSHVPMSRSGSATLMSDSVAALDPSDPSYRAYITKIQAELRPQRSLTELASIRRRERLVREAVVGKGPGVYSQLFKSSAQIGSTFKCNDDPGTHFLEDKKEHYSVICHFSSSSDELHSSSALSLPTSAGVLSGFVEPLHSSVLGQSSEGIKNYVQSGPPPDSPSPGTEQLPAAASPSSDRRPGSNVKPILPPIPTGRKTPAAATPPSPIPSPKLVNYLGHTASDTGVATDPSKVQKVQEWSVPTSLQEVCRFVGLASYYRRFVKDFASIAEPLHALTKKNAPFQWTEKCQLAFDELKHLLTTAPVLGYPLDQGDMILDTDASDIDIGGVLSQIQQGRERVLAYGSRKLSSAECNYCATQCELLAVVEYTSHFRQYLLGRPFIACTEHSSLHWLTKMKEPEGQLARSFERLGEYNFEIIHRPGRLHSNVDSLSRRPCCHCQSYPCKLPDPSPSSAVVPHMLHSDQGQNFESEVFQGMCAQFGMEKTHTTPFQPQSDGQVERFNATLQKILATTAERCHWDWDLMIPCALMADRATKHSTTAFSPNFMMFVHEVSEPIDLVAGLPPDSDLPTSVPSTQYKVGDAVLYLVKGTRKVKNKVRKLLPSYEGPYFILGQLDDLVYCIQKEPRTKGKVFHHDQLKPYCCREPLDNTWALEQAWGWTPEEVAPPTLDQDSANSELYLS